MNELFDAPISSNHNCILDETQFSNLFDIQSFPQLVNVEIMLDVN